MIKKRKLILGVILTWLGLVYSQSSIVIESQYLMAGEPVRFSLIPNQKGLSSAPTLKANPDNLNVQSTGRQTSIINGRRRSRLDFIAQIPDSSKTSITMPSLSLTYRDGSEEVVNGGEIQILPITEVEWKPAKLSGQDFYYGTAICLPGKKLYVGETVHCELKVILPSSIIIKSAGDPPQIETNGVSAWRFQLVSDKISRIVVNGVDYQLFTYAATVSANKVGKGSIGGGTQRMVYGEVQQSSNVGSIFQTWKSIPFELPISVTELEILPLPEGAPAGFMGAVGQFDFSRSVDRTELSDGVPLVMDVEISGKGNLDAISIPSLALDEEIWQAYPVTKIQRGEERKKVEGRVNFSQIIRPLKAVSKVPELPFSFFNPEKRKYETLIAPAIPLVFVENTDQPQTQGEILNSSAVAPSLPRVPELSMNDILGIIPSGVMARRDVLNTSLGWGAPIALGVISLVVLLLIIFERIKPSWKQSRLKARKMAQLKEIEFLQAQPVEFYREAARIVESELGGQNRSSALKKIVQKRDEMCFSSQKEEPKKSEIKTHYKALVTAIRATFLILTTVLMFWASVGSEVRASEVIDLDKAESAWQAGDWSTAQKIFQQAIENEASADLYYNLGNTYSRQKKYGTAVRYYHHALRYEARHPEALQNLRYMEHISGAVAFPGSQPQWLLGQLSKGGWVKLLVTGVLLLITVLLIFIWLKTCKMNGVFTRLFLWIGLIFGTLTLGTSLYATLSIMAEERDGFHYENDTLFILEDITSYSEPVRTLTEPNLNAGTVRELNEGTVVKVLLERGQWLYVESPNQDRGWIKKALLSPLFEKKS